MCIATVLNLPNRSQSIDYRAHQEVVGTVTVMELWLQAVMTSSRPTHVCIISHSSTNTELLRRLASVYDFHLHDASLPGELWALLELTDALEHAHRLTITHIALMPLGYLIAPPHLLDQMLDYHDRSGNGLTEARDLPSGVAPTVISRECLERLPELAALDGTLEVASIARTNGSVNTGGSCRAQTRPLVACFNASSVYGQPTEPIPSRVSIETPRDVGLLRSVFSIPTPAGSHGQGPWDVLARWHAASWRSQLDDRRALRSTLSPISGTRNGRSSTPRVLFVSHASALSGPETTLCRIADRVPQERFEKHALVGFDGSFAEQLRSSGVTVVCAEREFVRATSNEFLYCLKILQSVDPSLVHLNGHSGLSLVAACETLGIPIVLHARNGTIGPLESQVGSVDAVVAVSEYVARQVRRLCIAPDRVHVVHNGLDTRIFAAGTIDKLEARARLKLPTNEFVIGMIARFDPYKRHDVLLHAVADLRRRFGDVHVLLNGEVFDGGTHFCRVQALIGTLGLDNVVTWVPFVNDIRLIHAASDVVILCSEHEGMGTCILEAMAMEVPVIVSSGSGNDEVIENEKSGLVIPPGDSEALVSAIERMRCDTDLAVVCAKNARAFCERHLTADLAARRLMSIYDDVISRA